MKKPILTLLCALCVTVSAFAQEAVLHENIVRPSMTDAYHTAVMKIKEACAANKIKMSWRTLAFEDNTYGHAVAVDGKASLETDLWKELKSKIGDEAFDKLAADLEKNVESQLLGTMVFLPDHSYMDPKPDDGYRMILYIFPIAGKETDTEDLFLEWKKTYESNKTPLNFHVYKTSYGPDQGYLVSFSGKNPADVEAKIAATHQLLGDIGGELWKKQMSLTRKYFYKRGYIVPELSYAYEEGLAEK